jgi:hypothetical protein
MDVNNIVTRLAMAAMVQNLVGGAGADPQIFTTVRY